MARHVRLHSRDVRELAGRYDLDVVDFAALDGGAANSSCVVRTRHGRYVLTVIELDLDRALRLARLLEHLEAHDFPTSRLVRTAGGDMVTRHADRPVMLKRHIAGRVQAELDAASLRQIGAAMASMHKIDAPDCLPDQPPNGPEVYVDVIGGGIDEEYEAWLEARQAFFKAHIPSGLPRGLIHGDIFYDNVLWENGALKAIIDFEDACRYARAFDLGMGVVGLCVGVGSDTVDLDKARALLLGYQTVQPLEARERDTLQLFVDYAAVATSCWRFWKYHIDAATPERADRHRQMVRIADAVRAVPRGRFLDTVFG